MTQEDGCLGTTALVKLALYKKIPMKDFIIDLAINHPKFYRYTYIFWNFLDWTMRRIECARTTHRCGRRGSCINCGKKL